METLINSGFNDFIDGFNENLETFEGIKNYYSSNKKIIDVTNSILNVLNPSVNNQLKTVGNSNLIESVGQQGGATINLLDEITKLGSSSENISSSNNTKSNVFDFISDGLKDIREPSNNIKNAQSSQNKQFSFVKKTNTNTTATPNSSDYVTSQSKNGLLSVFSEMSLNTKTNNIPDNSLAQVHNKGFGFIKSKTPQTQNINLTSNNIEASPLENIFCSSNTQNIGIPTVDLTKSKITFY